MVELRNIDDPVTRIREQIMERASVPAQEAIGLRGGDRSAEQPIDARTRLMRDNAWSSLQELYLNQSVLEENRIVTVNRANPAHTPFDMIRTKVLQSFRQNGWTSVAITSPTQGCGKSTVALNLAFSFANQKDCRTAVIDLDLKEPSIDKLLGMRDAPSMESFLRGDSDMNAVFRRYEKNLAVGANRWPVKYSAELLQSMEAARVIKDMQQTMSPDIVIFDMASMLSRDDVMAVLPMVDCAILVAAAEQSTFEEVDACERDLSDRTNLLGVVLNKCRYSPKH